MEFLEGIIGKTKSIIGSGLSGSASSILLLSILVHVLNT